jgi:hypothetical protein
LEVTIMPATAEREMVLNVEIVADGFRRLIAMHKNDVAATLEYLEVPADHRPAATKQIDALLRGDRAAVSDFEKELESVENRVRAVANGGQTKYEVLTKWYVPYGERLYIDHTIASNAADITELVTAIAVACGARAASMVVGVAIGLAALKLLDRGNGIIVTRIPIFTGLCWPSTQ